MNEKRLRSYWWLILPLMLGIAVAIWLRPLQPAAPATALSLGGEFRLQAQQGPVALSDFRGQGVILFFGYTHCPDACPTGLSNVAAAMSRLNADEQASLQPLFISVDPERDSPEHLAQYVSYFHPRMIGLTGSTEQIDAVVRAYGAFYRKVVLADSALEYAVDHSTRLYLINRAGQVVGTPMHNTPIADLSEALRKLNDEG